MSIKTLQLITFDATGTLLKFRKPPTQIYTDFASRHGLRVNQGKLEKAFKTQWVKLNESQPHFGKCWSSWWVDFVTGTFSGSLIDPPKELNLKPFALKLIDHFKTAECMEVTAGTEDLLRKLKTDNKIKLGVISNFDPRLRDLLKLFKLHDYFDVISLSHELQLSKPDKRIFDLTLQNCKEPVERNESTVLHVGNDPDKDYFGARNAGWSAALIISSDSKKNSSIRDTDCFQSLEEFSRFLYEKS